MPMRNGCAIADLRCRESPLLNSHSSVTTDLSERQPMWRMSYAYMGLWAGHPEHHPTKQGASHDTATVRHCT